MQGLNEGPMSCNSSWANGTTMSKQTSRDAEERGGESPDHLASLLFRGGGSTGFIAKVYLQTSILFCISLLYSLSRPSECTTTRARDEEWRCSTPKWVSMNRSPWACGVGWGQARSRGVEGHCARPAHTLSLQWQWQQQQDGNGNGDNNKTATIQRWRQQCNDKDKDMTMTATTQQQRWRWQCDNEDDNMTMKMTRRQQRQWCNNEDNNDNATTKTMTTRQQQRQQWRDNDDDNDNNNHQ